MKEFYSAWGQDVTRLVRHLDTPIISGLVVLDYNVISENCCFVFHPVNFNFDRSSMQKKDKRKALFCSVFLMFCFVLL